MNQSSSSSLVTNTDNNIYPIEVLTQLSEQQLSGCLELTANSVVYYFYLYRGVIAYATNSIKPFERLERHLRRLSHQIPNLKGDFRNSVSLVFDVEAENYVDNPTDYKAISWMATAGHITKEQANILIISLAEEILDSYLILSKNYQYQYLKNAQIKEPLAKLDIINLIQKCQTRLKLWHSFLPQISSAYQRPYFFTKPDASAEQKKIAKILKGFSFRQLAAILNQNELVIVQKFYALIINKTIVIRAPQSPFDLLPTYSAETAKILESTVSQATNTEVKAETKSSELNFDDLPGQKETKKQWKIVCIDDSPSILKEIGRFLEGDEFSVFPITEPLKALMKIIRIKPDLILLDVGMPNIDGYKLCSLVRKYSAFQSTPIVMVTGNKGIIDRAKARLVGATDYMTKPFTQSDLLNIVFKYLS
ncbi:response regulator [Pleurocapsa sp. PCC 7319]|uniref:response regulator n=1 Tax=Pleurocapsa sp. PCC 7319 TaxID=118161 RepID=UPI00034B76D7|nr:response regulator [Pleurocapsa sp. PCC 7319]